jgi:RNA polymerase sigma-70 factor (ECF subfamily)
MYAAIDLNRTVGESVVFTANFFSSAGNRPTAGVLLVTDTETATMETVTPDLLTKLLDEQAGPLILFARQWCAVPEDVVQEAFVKLAAQQPVPTNAVGWLYQVVRHGAISAARSAARRTRHELAAARPGEAFFETDHTQDIDATDATHALRQLPMEQRETIVARVWGGLSFEEIAALTGTTRSTAHRRYAAGLAALRDCLNVRLGRGGCRNHE